MTLDSVVIVILLPQGQGKSHYSKSFGITDYEQVRPFRHSLYDVIQARETCAGPQSPLGVLGQCKTSPRM